MTKSPKKIHQIIIAIFFLNLIFLSGCRSTENVNSNNSNTTTKTAKKNAPSDNLEELLNLVKLPVVPTDVVWSEEELQNKKKLTAVLEYKPEDLPAIQNVLEKYKQPEPSEVGVEDWFPEQLKAKAQLSGVEVINGTGFGANEFFNIPYGSGKITRIEGTNYFVLELQTN